LGRRAAKSRRVIGSFLAEFGQVVAGKRPFERFADLGEVALEAEAVGEFRGTCEVVWRQGLALHDREVESRSD